MHITCPKCGFSAEIDLNKLSPTAVIANCPQCQNRFRFRELNQADEVINNSDLSEQNVNHENSPLNRDFDESAENNDYDKNAQQLFDDNQRAQNKRENEEKQNKAKSIWDELEAEHELEAQKRKQNKTDEDAWLNAHKPNSINLKKESKMSNWQQKLGLNNIDYSKIPWEHPGELGYAGAFFETCKRIILSPYRFFEGMQPIQSLLPAFAFACFWKFFDMILTVIYHPEIFNRLIESTSLKEADTSTHIIGSVVAAFVVSGMLFGILLLFALLLSLTTRFIVGKRPSFSQCFAIVCYPNTILILSVLPFTILILPVFIVSMFYQFVAIHKGLKLSIGEFAKVAGVLVLCFVLFLIVLQQFVASYITM
ncbi:zinc-ribbon domain-containing protein [Desulfovibrio litoralis]|uniref:Uncharacterized protein n=1 Tax=Desulfovibrio litoralis DSM 11393 TaxID=1121455 RepID=A0A1M7T5G2_9BACT|nr:zinc-ribbon domain-containing protein [Desulfovibrio litoralis]SHN65969.1 hypothetical protein SAMN02745728_01560 [Desulfovibrio litoralis DSM 11393]